MTTVFDGADIDHSGQGWSRMTVQVLRVTLATATDTAAPFHTLRKLTISWLALPRAHHEVVEPRC